MRLTRISLDPTASPTGALTLAYDERLVRRKRMTLDDGSEVMVDLPKATELPDGGTLFSDNGDTVAIHAAPEPVLIIRGAVLARLAWHIGNRHTPCEIHANHMVVQDNPVLRKMLLGLNAEVEQTQAPFSPEGGAYGHGRTMGHSHDH
jgi:urease accessory protein